MSLTADMTLISTNILLHKPKEKRYLVQIIPLDTHSTPSHCHVKVHGILKPKNILLGNMGSSPFSITEAIQGQY